MKPAGRRGSAQGSGRGPRESDPRLTACWILQQRFRTGRPLNHRFFRRRLEDLSLPDQALCRELVDGVLRNLRLLDYRLSRVVDRSLDQVEEAILWILRLSAYQIDFLRVPDYAAVDSGVELCRRVGRRFAGSFVNAVLRHYVRGGKPLPTLRGPADLAIAYSHPEWYVRRLLERYGWDATRRLLAANNERPPSVVWLNPFRGGSEAFLQQLRERRIHYQRLAWPDCLWVEAAGFVRHPLYLEGHCLFVNYGSQWVAHLADVADRRMVLDACAAPGGKSFILRSRLAENARLICGDTDWRRLEGMKDLAKRLAVPGLDFVRLDAAHSVPVRGYDFALVDVPCSGLGTLRSNPDVRWTVRESDLHGWRERQRRILRQVFVGLPVGGELLYSTCSTEPEENEDVVEFLLGEQGDAVLKGGYRRTFPEPGWGDGFFAACIARR